MCDPPADNALADAGELRRAAGVHAVAAGAVLAGHLAHAGVDAELRQRARQPVRRVPEAVVDARARLLVRARAWPISVPSWKTAARPPASRSVASKPCSRAARTASS